MQGQGGGPGAWGAHSLSVNLNPMRGFRAQAGRAGSLDGLCSRSLGAFCEEAAWLGVPSSLSSWPPATRSFAAASQSEEEHQALTIHKAHMHISTNNPGHHACPCPRAHPQGRVLPAKQKSPPALRCLGVCLSKSELHTLREGPGVGPGGVGGQQPGPPAPQPRTLRTPPPWTQADSSPQRGLFRRHLPLKREGFVFWMWELHLKCISPPRALPVTVLRAHRLDPREGTGVLLTRPLPA